MQFPRYSFVFAAALALAACADPGVPFQPVSLSVPVGENPQGPRLSGGGDQPLILSWMEKDADGHTLLYSTYRGGSWTEPETVVAGIDMFVNWADMPSVQPMGANRLAGHWLEKSGESTYAYDVVFTQSLDGGASWSDPVRPHSDGTETEHGFVSMFADGDGTGLIWLDGRNMVNEETGDPAATGMTLRGATIGAGSSVQDEHLIDELVCDCCQTDVAISDSGPVAVYRDRTAGEIRDIYVSRRIDGQWQPGKVIHDDAWEIPACPVNGPSIVANDPFVAVAWFTAANDEPAVKLAMSGDLGESWSWQIDVDRGHVAGQVGLVLLPGNRVAISWVARGEDGRAELRLQTIGLGGDLGDVHVVASGVGLRSVPQLGTVRNDLIVVWTKTEDFVNSVHSARIPVGAFGQITDAN